MALKDKRERLINRLITPNMTITLTNNQLGRMRNGSCSVSVNKDLVAIGIAHAAIKSLQSGSAGDEFKCQVITGDPGDEGNLKQVHNLVGPTDKFYPDFTRVITIKQNTKEGQDEYIVCLYDNRKVCFVNENANCLCVRRDQLVQSLQNKCRV